jgi:hypothetical protein
MLPVPMSLDIDETIEELEYGAVRLDADRTAGVRDIKATTIRILISPS